LFDKIYLDLIGPLTITERKNQYIAVAACYFSKYLITRPLKHATSASLAKFLLENIFLVFGVSKELVLANAKISYIS